MLKRCPVLLVLLMFVVHCAPVNEEVVARSIPSTTSTPTPIPTDVSHVTNPIPTPKIEVVGRRVFGSDLMDFVQERKIAGDMLEQVIPIVSEHTDVFHKIEENLSLINHGKEIWFIPTTLRVPKGPYCSIFVVQDSVVQSLRNIGVRNSCASIVGTIDYDGDGFDEPLLEIDLSPLSVIDEQDGKYEIIHFPHPQHQVYQIVSSMRVEDDELIVDGKTRANNCCVEGVSLTQHETSRFVYEPTTDSLNLVDQDISSIKIEYANVGSPKAQFIRISEPNQETEYSFNAGYGYLFYVALNSENDAVKLRVEESESGNAVKSDAWPPMYLGVNEMEHYTFITSNELEQAVPYTMTVMLIPYNVHVIDNETRAREFIRRANIFSFEDEQIRPILAEKGFDYLLDE